MLRLIEPRSETQSVLTNSCDVWFLIDFPTAFPVHDWATHPVETFSLVQKLTFEVNKI
jgi:hypothetical protein